MMAGATRSIILCADDYAISPGVSRGIVELARMGRLSATSAMSVAPDWPRLARGLDGVRDRIAIGLHLTFTGLAPLGAMPRFAPEGRFPPLGQVVRDALTRRLPLAEIAAEIDRQLDAFVAGFGREPDFVDGHQHVHALPGIRDALLAALVKRGLAGRVWLRDPADRAVSILRRRVEARKALVVGALALGFAEAARRAGFAANQGFSGFSGFDPAADLAVDFASYLVAPGPAHLVMCHPGHVDPGDVLDEVVESREREFAYLASDAFASLLAERDVVLTAVIPGPRSGTRNPRSST
jgi:predicted glycoside hydrolase/deacetylase ChbG (UPF0249 family)